MNTSNSEIPTEEIARRAYQRWEARGRPAGDGSDDWEAALAELTAQRRNGTAGGLRAWWEHLRQKITGRDM